VPGMTKSPMFLKIIALLAAAIPAYLFLRSMLGARPSMLGMAWREAKKQIDLGIYIFLGIIGGIVAFAVAKLAWGWWVAL
jgi:H+/Cl- antiporter ClcA